MFLVLRTLQRYRRNLFGENPGFRTRPTYSEFEKEIKDTIDFLSGTSPKGWFSVLLLSDSSSLCETDTFSVSRIWVTLRDNNNSHRNGVDTESLPFLPSTLSGCTPTHTHTQLDVRTRNLWLGVTMVLPSLGTTGRLFSLRDARRRKERVSVASTTPSSVLTILIGVRNSEREKFLSYLNLYSVVEISQCIQTQESGILFLKIDTEEWCRSPLLRWTVARFV